ncbi:MAG: SDR family oxidoreductase [Ignavibacteria bacterium]|jgi:enoyl-[acyl-carrier protein] reductase III|nr:SDR family oxidoreductase [Ignavibacteria bacterium]
MSKYYALILGASSGFGKAIALALAKDGVNIIGVHLDRSTTMPDVEKLISDIKDTGSEAHFFNVNAADPKNRTNVMDQVEKILSENENSTVKVFLHSLAFGTLKPFFADDPADEINQKQIEMTLDVMANSLVYWSQELVNRKLMVRGGKIYGMTSSGGQRQIEFYGAVSAAKACMESYIRQLAMELGRLGISANSIRAGVTETPALSKIPKSQNIIDNAIQRNPVHRLTTPEEVALFVVDNYKQDSHWMTGNVINLDGGESVVEL